MIIFPLAILLLFLIGSTYYSLAEEYHKKYLWLWAILGIVTYYVGRLILAFFFGFFGFLIIDLFNINLENISLQSLESLIGLVGGILGTFIFYRYLKYRWTTPLIENGNILDNDLGNDLDGN